MLRQRLLNVEWLRNLILAETWPERLAVIGRGLALVIAGALIFLIISYLNAGFPGSYR